MTQQPPRPTLFPYTTLFRSWLRAECNAVDAALARLQRVLVRLARQHHDAIVPGYTHLQRAQPIASRSEEHTSELQSLTNLVCRLLLEKKKKKLTKLQLDNHK